MDKERRCEEICCEHNFMHILPVYVYLDRALFKEIKDPLQLSNMTVIPVLDRRI